MTWFVCQIGGIPVKMKKIKVSLRLLIKWTVLLALINLSACQKEEKPAPEWNAVIQVPEYKQEFQKDLEGYQIMLIAPGSTTAPEKIERLQSIPDIRIQIPENTFSEEISFHSNSDENRFEMLKQLFQSNDPNIILWSLRGGYGSARLIEKLQTLPKPQTEKIIIGFSDLTVLHLFLSQKWGWKTINGAMLVDLLNAKKDPQNFLKISKLLAQLKNSTAAVYTEINHLLPLNEKASTVNSVEGVLTGGNLAMVETSIGTDWEIKTKDKILFFEDDGEKGYKIDRILNHLKQAGLLNDVRAIVFGDFTDGDEFVELALQRFANEIAVPVFKTDEFGHGIKNYPMIYNAKSTITKSKEGSDYNLSMQFR